MARDSTSNAGVAHCVRSSAVLSHAGDDELHVFLTDDNRGRRRRTELDPVVVAAILEVGPHSLGERFVDEQPATASGLAYCPTSHGATSEAPVGPGPPRYRENAPSP